MKNKILYQIKLKDPNSKGGEKTIYVLARNRLRASQLSETIFPKLKVIDIKTIRIKTSNYSELVNISYY